MIVTLSGVRDSVTKSQDGRIIILVDLSKLFKVYEPLGSS